VDPLVLRVGVDADGRVCAVAGVADRAEPSQVGRARLSAYSGGMCIQQLTLFTTPITYRIVFAIAASLCGLVYVVFGMRTDIRGGK
jgi:hypothetical protein